MTPTDEQSGKHSRSTINTGQSLDVDQASVVPSASLASLHTADNVRQLKFQPSDTLDRRAPRYHCYPAADRYMEAFSVKDYERHLACRQLMHGFRLSVYLHIPFCSQYCYSCNCTKAITHTDGQAEQYVLSLVDELNLLAEHLGDSQQLIQIHCGGGAPTCLAAPEITRLMNSLKEHFSLSTVGQFSIEIDPICIDSEKLGLLREQGFNQLRVGVQDFDANVQNAINRHFSKSMVQSVLDESREMGFKSANIELLVGLPRQSLDSFCQTVESVIQMRPERVVLHDYAHRPWRFKAQRMINGDEMPTEVQKRAIVEMAHDLFNAAGYEYIGMNQFALADDDLADAWRTGRLYRGFNGYSSQPEYDLIALGAGAISRVGSCYSQNLRDIDTYSDRISQGMLPTFQGIELSRDDILRRTIIMAILCQGEIDKSSIDTAFLINFDRYFEFELSALEPLAKNNLVELRENLIVVTPIGRRKALQLIAGMFNRYLQDKHSRNRFLQ